MAISGSLTFLSASLTGSVNINVDFVGLNTLIVDPVSRPSNQLGYESTNDSSLYYNNSIDTMGGTQATATFVGTAALNDANGTSMILINANGSTVNFHTDLSAHHASTSVSGSARGWTVNTAGIDVGDAATQIRRATQAAHIACLAAIAAGDLKMTAVPAADTGTQTSFTLTQTTAGAAGNTTITLITGMTADGATAFAGGTSNSIQPNQLNSLLLNRNGPYQHPMWKQYRGGEHPVARKLRLNNTMSIDATFADPIQRETVKRNVRGKLENDTHSEIDHYYEFLNALHSKGKAMPKLYRQPSLVRYYEPSVLKAHKPFIYTVNNFKVRSTLMNQMVFFENKKLNESLNIAGPDRTSASVDSAVKTPKQQYYDLLTAAKANGAFNFIYAQTIFPKSINAFRPYKLEKPSYEEIPGVESNGYDRTTNRSFWRNSQPGLTDYITGTAGTATVPSDGTSRMRTEGTASNSQDIVQTFYHPTVFDSREYEGSYTLYTTNSIHRDGDVAPHGATVRGKSWARGNTGPQETTADQWNFTYHFIEGGIISSGGVSTTAPVTTAATATITCADGDDSTTNAFSEGEYVKLIDAVGTKRVYVLVDGSETVSPSLATGDVIAAGVDIGAGAVPTSVTYLGICIAVVSNLNTHNQASILNEFRTAILSANGHNGTITCTDALTPTHGNQTMTLTQAYTTQATATFVGTAALNDADGTNLILTNADGSTVTFHTDPTKNFGDTSSDGGDHIWEVNTRDISGGSEVRKATQAFHIACLAAIAAGELDMTAVPATDTGTQTSFTLAQTTAGTAGNTAITLITGMTANGATAFAGGTNNAGSAGNGSAGNTTVTTTISQFTRTNFAGGHGSHLGEDGLPLAPPTAAFCTLESYQPYPITLLSMWPLDPRPDIYDSSIYLTSSIGGKGLQIGLTPHRAKEYDIWSGSYYATTSPVFTASLNWGASASPATAFVLGAGSLGQAAGYEYSETLGNLYPVTASATSSYGQIDNIQIGNAGELAYSTKPTIFFHRTGSMARDIKGYRYQTASLQFNRHTFPYNTPFYAVNKIRNRNPFYNSYADFAQDIKYFGRDYSIVPEYVVSKNIDFYYEKYFKSSLKNALYVVKKLSPQVYDTIAGDSFYDNAATKIVLAGTLQDPGATAEEAVPLRTRINIRNFKLPVAYSLYKKTKLNFLTIDGAFVTASSMEDSFSDASTSTSPPPTPGSSEVFAYDPLTKTTSVTTLQNLLNYNTSKSGFHYAQDVTASVFNEALAHADNAEEFSNLLSAPLADGVDTIPRQIKFTVHALKKLRPGKNFYPVTKTVDIGNKFKNFIYENLYEKVPIQYTRVGQTDQRPGQLQAFLEPFFAPGILYNSLKSGIAVDYPVYSAPPAYFAPWTFFSGSTPVYAEDGGGDITDLALSIQKNPTRFGDPHTSDRFTNFVTSSLNYGSFYMLGASRCIPAILNRYPDYRMPFEALYNTQILTDRYTYAGGSALYLTTDFVDLDINYPDNIATSASAASHKGAAWEHPGAAHTYTGPIGQLGKIADEDITRDLYESSINNFLCETMNFFLKDYEGNDGVKLPVFVSEAKHDSEIHLNADKSYNMEVSLKMGKDQVSCEGPRHAGIGGGSQVDNLFTSCHNINPAGTMRGYLYGPPIEIVRMSGSVTSELTERINDEGVFKYLEPLIESDAQAGVATGGGDYESYFGANLQDPAYQAFTPPYFYGKSTLVLAAENSSVINTWPDVFEEVENDSYYLDFYDTGSGLDALCRIAPGTGSVSGFYNTRMKIDSSVDIFKKASVQVRTPLEDGQVSSNFKNIWYISPKWICPVLDFSSSYAAVGDTRTQQGLLGEEKIVTSVVNNTYHDVTTGRGLWGGYGTDPYDMSAMIQVLQNSNLTAADKAGMEKGIILTIKDPLNVAKDTTTLNSYKAGLNASSGYYTEYSPTADATPDGSLGLELGFLRNPTDIKKINIGQLADQKEISEALVIVPYFEKPVILPAGKKFPSRELFRTREVIPGKHFLPIHTMLFRNLLSMAVAKRKYGLDRLLKGWHGDSGTNIVGFETTHEYNAARVTDVYKMIETILGDPENGIPGYELPPEFDFVNYGRSHPNLAANGPFQMIIIPVTHTLEKQELIDIYQGIMPESSLKFEKATESLNIKKLNTGPRTWMPKTKGFEFLGEVSPGASLSLMGAANFLDPGYLYNKQLLMHVPNTYLNSQWIKDSKDFYKNLKFMTFKIKQRANKNYDNYKNRQIEKIVKNKISSDISTGQTLTDFQFEFNTERQVSDVFGYNWPYDDFSLVEAVKIDIQFEVDK